MLLKVIRHAIGIIILTYVLALLAVVLLLDRALFQPHPPSYGLTDQTLFIPVGGGERIAAVWLPNKSARYTVLLSHGNGEDLGDIMPELREFHDRGYAVLAYDYRGYGLSSGSPGEDNANADVEAAYRYLTETLKVAPERIIVHGYSVGGGPSVDLASRHTVGGLVLESTFTSAVRTVTRIPLFPVDRFRNIDKIGAVTAPILVIHGTDDRIVPYLLGEALYGAAPSPKRLVRVEQAGHYDLRERAGERYWQAYDTFIPGSSTAVPELHRDDASFRSGR